MLADRNKMGILLNVQCFWQLRHTSEVEHLAVRYGVAFNGAFG